MPTLAVPAAADGGCEKNPIRAARWRWPRRRLARGGRGGKSAEAEKEGQRAGWRTPDTTQIDARTMIALWDYRMKVGAGAPVYTLALLHLMLPSAAAAAGQPRPGAVLLLPAGNVVTSHISATEASPDCGKALGGFWSHSEWLVNGHSGRDGVSTSRTEMPWTISRWNSTCLRACNIRDKL